VCTICCCGWQAMAEPRWWFLHSFTNDEWFYNHSLALSGSTFTFWKQLILGGNFKKQYGRLLPRLRENSWTFLCLWTHIQSAKQKFRNFWSPKCYGQIFFEKNAGVKVWSLTIGNGPFWPLIVSYYTNRLLLIPQYRQPAYTERIEEKKLFCLWCFACWNWTIFKNSKDWTFSKILNILKLWPCLFVTVSTRLARWLWPWPRPLSRNVAV